MKRFYTPPEQFAGSTVHLTETASRRVNTVLHMALGSEISVFDGSGREWIVEITGSKQGAVECKIVEQVKWLEASPRLKLTLLLSLIQTERFEIAVEKCTELGVSKFVPVISDRVQGGAEAAPSSGRLERWRRIVVSASEQSGRRTLPIFAPSASLIDAIELQTQTGIPTIVLWESERNSSLREVLGTVDMQSDCLALAIGPVGGISDREIEKIEAAKAKTAGLGKRALRAETAAIAACTIALEFLGDLRLD